MERIELLLLHLDVAGVGTESCECRTTGVSKGIQNFQWPTGDAIIITIVIVVTVIVLAVAAELVVDPLPILPLFRKTSQLAVFRQIKLHAYAVPIRIVEGDTPIRLIVKGLNGLPLR